MTGLEHSELSHLALLDLSPLPRFGLKGVSMQAWLDDRGFTVGEVSNRAYPQNDGSLVARLSPAELLFLCDPEHPLMSADHDYLRPGRDCYMIRRQDSHFWFAITGEKAPSMLAKLCGVNFDPQAFDHHRLAQTQVARISAIVVRSDIGGILCYYLLGDNSYHAYMKGCIRDAMQEFEGRLINPAFN